MDTPLCPPLDGDLVETHWNYDKQMFFASSIPLLDDIELLPKKLI